MVGWGGGGGGGGGSGGGSGGGGGGGGGVVTASCVPLGVLPTLLYGHHGDSQLGLGSVLGVDGWVGR